MAVDWLDQFKHPEYFVTCVVVMLFNTNFLSVELWVKCLPVCMYM
jgi:hypothetical protein